MTCRKNYWGTCFQQLTTYMYKKKKRKKILTRFSRRRQTRNCLFSRRNGNRQTRKMAGKSWSRGYFCRSRFTYTRCKISLVFILKKRFHLVVRLFSDNAMTSKRGTKNRCSVTDVLTTLRHVSSVRYQRTHAYMESICFYTMI